MRITTQGDYALRCLLNIARNGVSGPVAISRISEQERLPVDYIEHLLLKLRRKKLIRSVRGVKGGYVLNGGPSQISVKHVLQAVEGSCFEVICERKSRTKKRVCQHADRECVLRSMWQGLKSEVDHFLERYTLASLMAEIIPGEGKTGGVL
jgi:Rrf2 family protein